MGHGFLFRVLPALVASGAAVVLGCGSTTPSASATADDGGFHDGGSPDGAAGAGLSDGGTANAEASLSDGPPGDALATAACAPAIPLVAWTSPYAGWSRGIPANPSFFPIGVWLQGSWHATELAALGINIYIGNNSGTDSLAASDLATLKAQGIYAIVGQDSVGLANIDDPTIIGWWMTPDEPDNAQPVSGGGYGPAVNPSTLVTEYGSYKTADSTRPMWLGLGQGVAYDAWEGVAATRRPNPATSRRATSSPSTSTRTTTAGATVTRWPRAASSG